MAQLDNAGGVWSPFPPKPPAPPPFPSPPPTPPPPPGKEISFEGVTSFTTSESTTSTGTTTSSSNAMEHHGHSGCRHAFYLNNCPPGLAVPGYCGLYSANASSAFCYGRFVFRQEADPSFVYFFSSYLGAWQASNLVVYNLTLGSLCDSMFGDIYHIEASKALNPGLYGSTAFDPVIRGRNASNFVWFDSAGNQHSQALDNSTTINITAAHDHLPLDQRGIIKMCATLAAFVCSCIPAPRACPVLRPVS
jgi:hypothetical protein